MIPLDHPQLVAFLRAVLRQDGRPHLTEALIFADWLEEQGWTVRAETIRGLARGYRSDCYAFQYDVALLFVPYYCICSGRVRRDHNYTFCPAGLARDKKRFGVLRSRFGRSPRSVLRDGSGRSA